MGTRTVSVFLLAAAFLIPLTDGSSAFDIALEEDSYLLLDLHREGFFQNDTIGSLLIETNRSLLEAEAEGDLLNISGSPDAYGEGILIVSNSSALVNISVTVTPVQDDPVIRGIELRGDPTDLENPVNATVDVFDPDGDELTITWRLNGEPVMYGPCFRRYVYPGRKNLSVIVDDGQGGIDEEWVEISTRPPPGWGERSDNTRNRVIFWLIFGSGGLIIAGAVFWTWIRKPEVHMKKNNGNNL